ncbi:MAG: VOC family protein [Candidatus Methanolliviera hydrocarbonicum]|uniref:VOC family protein n=1 Tax=Candidatus Methanolliviera hydrocarbonicum TaxID=2491085 RepID=A0A520KWP5_9EURY|nr:MAG: VOC family protein [Candidatus Methanolliviera hydrocarbonicum]
MPTITHFMVPAEDTERAKKFYTELFGWKVEKLPGPMEYYEISTITSDGEEGLGGGMAKRESPGETITNYIDVPSVDEYIAKVEKLGGKVVLPKTAVPGIGYVAVCLDTEKNTFGLWGHDIKRGQAERLLFRCVC